MVGHSVVWWLPVVKLVENLGRNRRGQTFAFAVGMSRGRSELRLRVVPGDGGGMEKKCRIIV